jgi:hypothetical protein
MRTFVAAMLALFLAVSVFAQTDMQGRLVGSATHVYEMQSASGDLTAGTTTGSIWTAPHIDIVIVLDVTKLTLADGDDEVDFYFQTTYDGSNWTDLENIHFDNADNGSTTTRIVRLGPWAPLSTADKGAANTDGALADDTKLAYPVGWLIRIKTTVTGATAPTYAFSAVVFLR